MNKIEGIILAAGFSSRANTYKLNLIINGKTILENCIEGMYEICSRIIIVGGYNIDKIKYIPKKYNKVKLILNPNYEAGMFSSIKEGLKYIKEERFFLTPGDYPLIKKDVYKIMANIGKDIVIPAYKNKKGHPVLIKSYLINEIINNTIYSSLKDYIINKDYFIVNVQDKGILLDVDTINDYHNICKDLLKKG